MWGMEKKIRGVIAFHSKFNKSTQIIKGEGIEVGKEKGKIKESQVLTVHSLSISHAHQLKSYYLK
jgi:hypothetical protein